jgi:RNase P subunit RPR2
MNQRDQWSSSLPPQHSPMTEEIRQLASTCGINLSSEDLGFVTQLIFGYLSNSKRPDGNRILYKLLKLAGHKTQPASYMRTYYKEGYFGMEEHKIPYDKLEQLSVWLYDGRVVVPNDMVEIMDRPDHNACDDCGVLVPAKYCSATVNEWSNGKEHLVTLCNHCRSNKEDPKIRDTAKRSTCEDCKVTGCSYWKEYHKQPTVEESRRPSLAPLNNFTQKQIEQKPMSPQERYASL